MASWPIRPTSEVSLRRRDDPRTVVHASHLYDVTKLLYLGSSCIYPRQAGQPIIEEDLLAGPLKPTNEACALAKIAGIKLCSSYRARQLNSAMQTNLYRPNDNFDLNSSHVLPAHPQVPRHEGQRGDPVRDLGTGSTMREFLPVRACFSCSTTKRKATSTSALARIAVSGRWQRSSTTSCIRGRAGV